MELDDITITKAIIDDFSKTFIDYTEVDVALVGGGPANMVAATRLSQEGYKVALFEKKLALGGGMWGGGMMFPRIVVQDEARKILEDFGINHYEYDNEKGYYIANSIESVSRLINKTVTSGAQVFNLVNFEDVMIREDDHVTGIVINWAAVSIANLHVDPLTIRAKVVIDGTGHEAVVCNTVQRKIPNAKFEGVVGERPMWADAGEKSLKETTREVYPGLIVTGMAANAVAGAPRMGPVFGGMLLSGEMAAKIAMSKLD
jgi:thiamine thiazole synthase